MFPHFSSLRFSRHHRGSNSASAPSTTTSFIRRRRHSGSTGPPEGHARTNPAVFRANSYDYLLARLQEKTGDSAGAAANYQSEIARNSVLSEYSIWHLAQMSRGTGDLVQEREQLRQLLTVAPHSLLRDSTSMRLGQSFFESQDFNAAVAALKVLVGSKNKAVAREAQTLTGQALIQAGKPSEARDVFTRLLMQMPDASRPDDFALAAVRALDSSMLEALLLNKTGSPNCLKRNICCADRSTSSIATSTPLDCTTRPSWIDFLKIPLLPTPLPDRTRLLPAAEI